MRLTVGKSAFIELWPCENIMRSLQLFDKLPYSYIRTHMIHVKLYLQTKGYIAVLEFRQFATLWIQKNN